MSGYAFLKDIRMKNDKREHLEIENAVVVEEEKSNLKGDYTNMALLLGLYFLQGIISGITSGTIEYICFFSA